MAETKKKRISNVKLGRPPKSHFGAMTPAERQRQYRQRLKEQGRQPRVGKPVNELSAVAETSHGRKALSIAHGVSGYALRLSRMTGLDKPDIREIRDYVGALVNQMHCLMTILSVEDPDNQMVVAMLKMLDDDDGGAAERRRRPYKYQ